MKIINRIIFSVCVLSCLTLSTAHASESGQTESETIVMYAKNKLIVENVAENTKIEVSNMLGVKVFTGKTTRKDRDTFDVGLNRGFYIVRVGCCEVKRILVK